MSLFISFSCSLRVICVSLFLPWILLSVYDSNLRNKDIYPYKYIFLDDDGLSLSCTHKLIFELQAIIC